MSVLYARPSSLVEVPDKMKIDVKEDSISAVRAADVEFGDLYQAILFLMPTIVQQGGNGDVVRWPGDRFPGIEIIECMSVKVSALGKDVDSNWTEGPKKAKCRLEIGFGIPKTTEHDGPENQTVLIESVDYETDLLTVNVKGATDNVTTKKHIRLPKIVYTAEIPKLVAPRWDLLRSYTGDINQNPLFGGAAGTVLFDGPKLNRTVDILNPATWKLQMNFIYNKYGWNKTLNPKTLVWEQDEALSGNELAYEESPLENIWS